MNDATKITLYILGTLLLGCLLAPPLYWAGHASGIPYLLDQPFQRYFNRAMLIAALALLWPALRWLNLQGWRDLGLRPNPSPWKHIFLGFTAAFFLLLLLGGVAWALDLYRMHDDIRWDKLAKMPLTAVTVALLEEFFFRAAMFGLVRRSMGTWGAAVFVSAIYSIVHFLKPLHRELESINMTSGFLILPDAFHQFAEPLLLLGGFSTLFAIGMVLNFTVIRSGSVWMAVGLHAGWIAGNRTFNILFKRRDELQPWFGERMEIGLAPLLTILLTGLLVAYFLRRDSRGHMA